MINLYDVGCPNPHRVQAALHRLFFHVQKSGELIPEVGGTVPLVSFNQKSLLHNALQVKLVLIPRKNCLPWCPDCRQTHKGHTHPPWHSRHIHPANVLTFV